VYCDELNVERPFGERLSMIIDPFGNPEVLLSLGSRSTGLSVSDDPCAVSDPAGGMVATWMLGEGGPEVRPLIVAGTTFR